MKKKIKAWKFWWPSGKSERRSNWHKLNECDAWHCVCYSHKVCSRVHGH